MLPEHKIHSIWVGTTHWLNLEEKKMSDISKEKKIKTSDNALKEISHFVEKRPESFIMIFQNYVWRCIDKLENYGSFKNCELSISLLYQNN